MPTDNFGFEQRQAEIRSRVATICLKYMNRRNISRQQFANLVQLSTSQLKEIINRNSNTTLNVLVKISIVTGEKIEI
jgi:plasmid maintenance system antidote protein VapI